MGKYHLRGRHLKLIAYHSAKHSIRGGMGLVFTFLTLIVGLSIAAVFISPIEQIARHAKASGVDSGSEAENTKEILDQLVHEGKPAIKWALGADDEQVTYLTETKPALVSAIFIALLFAVPFLVVFGAFNQTAGDISNKGLRYLLLRTERANIFVGRFLGTLLFTWIVLAILMAILLLYLAFKAKFYPFGDLGLWMLQGYIAMCIFTVPYVALCAWISGAVDSAFVSMVLALLVAGFIPMIVAIARNINAAAGYFGYVLPWPLKYELISGDITHVLGSIAAMAGFTALFMFLRPPQLPDEGPLMSGVADSAVAAISIKGITKRFGQQTALNAVSFDVPQRSVFGLLGPNGAGKTTLFSLVAGFLKADQGSIQVLGIDIEQISELRGRLTILPQDALFQANVPVIEQLIFFAQLTGYSRADAEVVATRVLGLVGLAEAAKKNPRTLSHGMSKRLGIAQAFLGKPEVILLDEPTAGLDPVNAKATRELIRSIQTTATLVVSSHDLDEIQHMCSHVAIVDKGKLVECNTVSSIVQTTRKVRFSFARALNPAELTTVRGVLGISDVVDGAEAGDYMVLMDPVAAGRKQEDVIAEVVQKLAAGGLVPRSVSEGASLESRFLEVTGAKT